MIDLQAAILDRVGRYLDTWQSGDLGARRRLFAPGATLEDPVGAPPIEGLDAIERYWVSLAADGAAFEPELRRVVVSGREALAVYLMKAEPPQGPAIITEVFATFEFDAAMEIRRLRFYRDDSCLHAPTT